MRPVKTYDFIIVLKQPVSYYFIDWISRLMLFMAVAAFIFEGLTNISHHEPLILATRYFFIALAIVAWWVYCYIQSREGKTPFYRFALMLAAWGWYFYPHGNALTIVYLAAAILEKPVKVQPEYAFDEESVVFNSFPQKKYAWSEITNAILKDGILTIDLKNNKLIQKEVNDDVSSQDEKDFNEFCRQRLNTNGI
jgi:hypothetical protein